MEINEELGWTVFGCVLVVAIFVTIITVVQTVNETYRQAIKAGLVEKQCIGTTGTYWTRP